jgi:hypothetical protein
MIIKMMMMMTMMMKKIKQQKEFLAWQFHAEQDALVDNMLNCNECQYHSVGVLCPIVMVMYQEDMGLIIP